MDLERPLPPSAGFVKPLGLPVGSVRALLLLALTARAILDLRAGRGLADWLGGGADRLGRRPTSRRGRPAARRRPDGRWACPRARFACSSSPRWSTGRGSTSATSPADVGTDAGAVGAGGVPAAAAWCARVAPSRARGRDRRGHLAHLPPAGAAHARRRRRARVPGRAARRRTLRPGCRRSSRPAARITPARAERPAQRAAAGPARFTLTTSTRWSAASSASTRRSVVWVGRPQSSWIVARTYERSDVRRSSER